MTFSEPHSTRFQRALLHSAFGTTAWVARALLRAPRDIEVLRNIPYLSDNAPAHRFDLYRPKARQGLLPLIVYIHGGGFTLCSKETHFKMAELFAMAGFCVANVEYRLAPRAPYPAAVQDVRDAWHFITAHADAYGAAADRAVLAGESAGANLALGLALHLGTAALDTPRPCALLASCGLLQVSDPARFQARPFVQTRIDAITWAYAPDPRAAAEPMASPLLWVEDLKAPVSLPPVLVQVGTRDPIGADSLRLHSALERRGICSTLQTYEGQGHAFHALYWTRAAQQCWRDTFAFLQGCGLLPQACGARTPSS